MNIQQRIKNFLIPLQSDMMSSSKLVHLSSQDTISLLANIFLLLLLLFFVKHIDPVELKQNKWLVSKHKFSIYIMFWRQKWLGNMPSDESFNREIAFFVRMFMWCKTA